MQRTLVIAKPDAVQRQLVGRIIARFEDKGLKLVALKMLTLTLPQARRMYAVHKGKEFYERLIVFMTSGPVVAMVLEGNEAISVVRGLVGPTFGPDAPAGTIRGDYGLSRRYNLVHASDSPAAVRRETPVFFTRRELAGYDLAATRWILDLTTGKPI
ncbi:MAG: nucleoside-diphosphate kinase [Phycisphaerae bacterium]